MTLAEGMTSTISFCPPDTHLPLTDSYEPPSVLSADDPSIHNKSSRILDEIESLWFSTQKTHRDNLLKVGGLIQQYLELNHQQCQDFSEKKTTTPPVRRSDIVKRLACCLRIKRDRVYLLVNTTITLSLLGGNVSLNNTSYSVIVAFNKCVRRIEKTEKWVLRSSCTAAVEIFKQAVAERWTNEDVRRSLSINRIKKSGKRRCDEAQRDRINRETSLLSVVGRGAPKDVADAIRQSVLAASKPRELAKAIISNLSSIAADERLTWSS